MGADQFTHWSTGKTSEDAFATARAQAEYDHGHSGYTGTIAEKDEFILIATVDSVAAAEDMAATLMQNDDPRICDKWGPAGCIAVKSNKKYLFFGWASC